MSLYQNWITPLPQEHRDLRARPGAGVQGAAAAGERHQVRAPILNIDIDTFVTLLSTVAFLLPLVYSLYSASVLRGGCYYSLLCKCPVAETVE